MEHSVHAETQLPSAKGDSLNNLIHARGREEDANLLSIPLQLLVLGMAEFQVALVFPIRLPPGMLRSIRPLQGFPIKLVLQLTLLELGTISPALLQHTLGLFPMRREREEKCWGNCYDIIIFKNNADLQRW